MAIILLCLRIVYTFNYISVQVNITAENVGNVVGELNSLVSEGTSAQDQSEGNLAVVQNVFSGAADLAGNISYSEGVSGPFQCFYHYTHLHCTFSFLLLIYYHHYMMKLFSW